MCNDMSREKKEDVCSQQVNLCYEKNDRLHEADGRSEKNRKWECLIIRKRILILANGVPVISTF